jgi:hypothetical protein
MARFFFSLLARQDRLHRVARLRDVGQIEGRLGLHGRLARGAAAAPAAEEVAYLLGLVNFDRTGVRLLLVWIQTE